MRGVLLLAGVLVLGFTIWLASGGFAEVQAPVGPSQPAAVGAARQPAPAAQAAAAPPVERGPVAPTSDDRFVSESEDDGAITNPVRDGLTMLVLDGDRKPMPNAKVEVHWRKGWGMYGKDRGRTDVNGRFVTTVAMHEMLEGFTLRHEEHGEIEFFDAFLPLANEPRTVMVFVPKLVAVRVVVRGTDGFAIGTAKVKGEVAPVEHAPREHPLLPYHPEGVTDDRGQVTLMVHPGEVRFEVEAEAFELVGKASAEVGPDGLDLVLLMRKPPIRHEVQVTVQVPEGMAPEFHVSARADAPQLPVLSGVRYSDTQPHFAVLQVDATRFVVHAEPGSWQLFVSGKQFGRVLIPVAASQTEVVVALERAALPPMARLKCRILLPDGAQTWGEVMVHDTPDLVHGSKVGTEPKHGDLAIIEREPEGKVCVSAWVHGYPIAVAGPFELGVGEQEVVLQLERPLSIRGRVVDEEGKPVQAHVNVHRPAGALQQLEAGVPAILAHAASGDLGGTLDDGTFRFEGLGAGEHELHVWIDGCGWPARQRVQPGQQDIVVQLGQGIDHLAKVEGRMTRAGTNDGAPGAVWLRSGEHNEKVYVGADGRFRMAVPPGRYSLEAVSSRCAFVRQGLRDLAAELTTWDVVVAPSEPLFVRVVDQNGVPVAEMEVEAHDAQGVALPLVDAMGNPDGDVQETSKSGRVGLHGLPDVALVLVLARDGKRQAVPIAAGTPRTAELEVVWKPGS
jgi:hypothetical protein